MSVVADAIKTAEKTIMEVKYNGFEFWTCSTLSIDILAVFCDILNFKADADYVLSL